jgi:hypothetical protein
MPADQRRDEAPEESASRESPQTVAGFTSLRHFLFVLAVNLLVLAETCVGLYRSSQDPDNFTPVFFETFFSLLVPTLVLAAVGRRFFRRKAKP